jgi:hypothetical protein
MPLVYERAFGGVDRKSENPDRDFFWSNPVGTGFGLKLESVVGTALPNIEYTDQLITRWDARPRPAGFGAIACHWQPRAEFTGTYDDAWMKERQPLLPNDFDDRFYLSAPQDQQSPHHLRGGEPSVLLGLTIAGDLRFFLPKVFLGFETRFYGGASEVHKSRTLHTVILEPDVPRVSLVWHTALPCHFEVHKLQRTIVSVREPIGTHHSTDIGEEYELAG